MVAMIGLMAVAWAFSAAAADSMDAAHAARMGAANAELRECGEREVVNLDDGITQADIIAKAVASRCFEKVMAAVSARQSFYPTEGGTSAAFTKEMSGDSAILLDVVLSYRAARR
jgi:hypothetical protein